VTPQSHPGLFVVALCILVSIFVNVRAKVLAEALGLLWKAGFSREQ
jgi:hypothetical protein